MLQYINAYRLISSHLNILVKKKRKKPVVLRSPCIIILFKCAITPQICLNECTVVVPELPCRTAPVGGAVAGSSGAGVRCLGDSYSISADVSQFEPHDVVVMAFNHHVVIQAQKVRLRWPAES